MNEDDNAIGPLRTTIREAQAAIRNVDFTIAQAQVAKWRAKQEIMKAREALKRLIGGNEDAY